MATSVALFVAARSGNLAEVTRLLAAGANPNVIFLNRAHMETAAIIEAALNNHTDVIRRLVEGGADLNIRGYYNHTALTNILGALHYMSANKSTIQTLIDVGINLDAQTRDGKTALMIAIEYQKDNIVRLLVDAGASLTIHDVYGNTALSKAKTHKPHMIQIMINKTYEPRRVFRKLIGAIPVKLKKGAKPNYGRFSEVNPETYNNIIGPFIGPANVALKNIPREIVSENNNNLAEHNLGAIQINVNNNDGNNTNNANRNNDHNDLIKLFGPFKATQKKKRNNEHNNLIKLFGPFKPTQNAKRGGRHRKTKKRVSSRRKRSHKRRV